MTWVTSIEDSLLGKPFESCVVKVKMRMTVGGICHIILVNNSILSLQLNDEVFAEANVIRIICMFID